MAVLPERENLDRVYFELSRHPEWLWPRDPAAQIPSGLAEELLSMSDDVATTVWLLLVWQEEFVATDFVAKVDIESVVSEFRNEAGNCVAARERLAEEVDGLIETAGKFCERISNLIENGVILGNDQVTSYCTENLDRMLNAWTDYRSRLQAVAGTW